MKVWLQGQKNNFLLVTGLLFGHSFIVAEEAPPAAETKPAETPTPVAETKSAETPAPAPAPDAKPEEKAPEGTAPAAETKPVENNSSATPQEGAKSEKVMIKEEDPGKEVIVVPEIIQPILKESSTALKSMEKGLKEASALCYVLRAKLRMVDADLDKFYEEMARSLGGLATQSERLQVHTTRKMGICQKQAYDVAHQFISKLQAVTDQLVAFKVDLEKIKGDQKAVDAIEDAMREKIKGVDEVFSALTKLANESNVVHRQIETALDEAKAKELSAKIVANLATFNEKKNNLQDGLGKEITQLGTQIQEKIKSVKDQATALTEKINTLQKENDGIEVSGLVKGELQEKKGEEQNKEQDDSKVQDAEVVQAKGKEVSGPKIIQHKKVRLEQKSMIRLSMESIYSAFADIFNSARGFALRMMGGQKIEGAYIEKKSESTNMKRKGEAHDKNAEHNVDAKKGLPSLDQKIEELAKMKKTREEQLQKLEEIDQKMRQEGVEVTKAAEQTDKTFFGSLKNTVYLGYNGVKDTLRKWLTPKTPEEDQKKSSDSVKEQVVMTEEKPSEEKKEEPAPTPADVKAEGSKSEEKPAEEKPSEEKKEEPTPAPTDVKAEEPKPEEKPAEEKPSEEKKEEPTPVPADVKAGEPKAEEKPVEEKPTEEKKEEPAPAPTDVKAGESKPEEKPAEVKPAEEKKEEPAPAATDVKAEEPKPEEKPAETPAPAAAEEPKKETTETSAVPA